MGGKKIPLSVIRRMIEYNHHFTIGAYAVIAHSAVLSSHYTFWHDTTAHNAACNYLFPEGGELCKTAMSSSVPFIKRLSPLRQSLGQTDSLGLCREFKQVSHQEGHRYSSHLDWRTKSSKTQRTPTLHILSKPVFFNLFIFVRYHTLTFSFFPDCHCLPIKLRQ